MRTIRVVLITAGLAMVVFGVASAAGSVDFKPFRHGLFLVAVLIGHDLLLMPVFLGVGVLVGRLVPAAFRAIVQSALIVTAAVTVVALPFVLGFGFRADIPSALPRNYVGGYLLVLGVVWLVVAVVVGYRRWASAHRVARAARSARERARSDDG